MSEIAIIGIDYDEPDPTTYRGSTLRIGEGQIQVCGCCPLHDLAGLCAVAIFTLGEDTIYRSSSVDHFLIDGGDYNMEVK